MAGSLGAVRAGERKPCPACCRLQLSTSCTRLVLPEGPCACPLRSAGLAQEKRQSTGCAGTCQGMRGSYVRTGWPGLWDRYSAGKASPTASLPTGGSKRRTLRDAPSRTTTTLEGGQNAHTGRSHALRMACACDRKLCTRQLLGGFILTQPLHDVQRGRALLGDQLRAGVEAARSHGGAHAGQLQQLPRLNLLHLHGSQLCLWSGVRSLSQAAALAQCTGASSHQLNAAWATAIARQPAPGQPAGWQWQGCSLAAQHSDL